MSVTRCSSDRRPAVPLMALCLVALVLAPLLAPAPLLAQAAAPAPATAEAICRTAIEAGETDLTRRRLVAKCPGCRCRRDVDALGLESREPCESILRGDVREGPVHHHDAGGEPEQKDHRQRHTDPAVDEYQQTLQECRRPGHAGDESRVATRWKKLKIS